jgi:hypothetical protein
MQLTCRTTLVVMQDDMAQERRRTGAIVRQAHRDAGPGETFPALEVRLPLHPHHDLPPHGLAHGRIRTDRRRSAR